MLAGAYYTVTDLGDARYADGTAPALEYQYRNGTVSVTNPITGITVPFEKTYVTLPLLKITPGYIDKIQGRNYGDFIPTSIIQANASGYLIGKENVNPNSGNSSDFDYVLLKATQDGGAQKLGVMDSHQYDGAPPSSARVDLSNSNMVLAHTRLYDINTGKFTSISDLLPPDGHYLSPYGVAIDDLGRMIILATTYDPLKAVPYDPQSGYDERYLLLAPPTVTPEPTTLVIFGAIAAGIGLRRLRRPGKLV